MSNNQWFGLRVSLVWLGLLAAFATFVSGFDLQFGFVRDKLPHLLGLTLTPEGMLQGVPLTLLVCAGAMVIS